MTDFALDRYWEDEKAPPLPARGDTQAEDMPRTDVRALEQQPSAAPPQIPLTPVPQASKPAKAPSPPQSAKPQKEEAGDPAKAQTPEEVWRARLIEAVTLITLDDPEPLRAAIMALLIDASEMTKTQAPDYGAPILSAFMARAAPERAELRAALIDALTAHLAHPLAAFLLIRLAALPVAPPAPPPPAPTDG